MKQVDVVVVGDGPGGSSAAYFLARAGVRVILLDKETFPRDKACGDGASRRSLSQLARMGLNGSLEAEGFHAPTGVRIRAPSGELASLEIPFRSAPSHSFGRFIPRKKLDAALFEAAIAVGAESVAGVRATGMSLDDHGGNVFVIANNKAETLHCQIVIAADGTKGSFSRNIGLQNGPLLGIAARAYLAGDDLYESFVDVLYEPDILPCYGWVFPVGHGV